MAMVACPQCGLPREEEQIGVVSCPLCALSPPMESVAAGPALPQPQASDPTLGLAADVSEWKSQESTLRLSSPVSGHFGRVVPFLLGVAVGVGGALVWQFGFRGSDDKEVTKRAPIENSVAKHPVSGVVFRPVAPMPREWRFFEPAPAPRSVAMTIPGKAPVHQRVEKVHQPDSTYTVPRLKAGDHLLLKGRARQLHISGLEGGAILDASEFEAGVVTIESAITGGSFLRLNAPESIVTFSALISGKSRVEIAAPGGQVVFHIPTDRPRPIIDAGSTVTITARTAHLLGDIDGADTKVLVSLTRNGSLKVNAVRGQAVVEYRDEDSRSRVTAGFVASTATFNKIE